LYGHAITELLALWLAGFSALQVLCYWEWQSATTNHKAGCGDCVGLLGELRTEPAAPARSMCQHFQAYSIKVAAL
jgi:hypothetical protein